MTKKSKSKNLDEVMHIVINETHHIEVSVDGQALPLKIGDKIKGMDEQIKDGITLRVCSCKIMEVVIDKSLLCEPLPKDLYGRSIAFL